MQLINSGNNGNKLSLLNLQRSSCCPLQVMEQRVIVAQIVVTGNVPVHYREEHTSLLVSDVHISLWLSDVHISLWLSDVHISLA